MRIRWLTVLMMVLLPLTAALAQAPETGAPQVERIVGDAQAGRQAFMRCAGCHAVEPGVHRAGPSLHNVVGRQAGRAEGYAYSSAYREAELSWTPENLVAYMADMRAYIPGSRKNAPAVRSPEARADIVAYLAGLTGEAQGR